MSNVIVPSSFDPEKHCGARLKSGDRLCMNPAGYRTDLPGDPTKRCYLHGGISGNLKHGDKSKTYGSERPAKYRKPLREQIEDFKNDPQLLALDEHIAMLKAMIRRKRELAEDQMDRYDEFMAVVAEAAATTGEMPTIPAELIPELPMAEIELLGKLVKQEYEMRYGRRHSIPVLELEAILVQIVGAFNDVTKRYGLPDEARRAFADRIANLRTSAPLEDPNLVRQGIPRSVAPPRTLLSMRREFEEMELQELN